MDIARDPERARLSAISGRSSLANEMAMSAVDDLAPFAELAEEDFRGKGFALDEELRLTDVAADELSQHPTHRDDEAPQHLPQHQDHESLDEPLVVGEEGPMTEPQPLRRTARIAAVQEKQKQNQQRDDNNASGPQLGIAERAAIAKESELHRRKRLRRRQRTVADDKIERSNKELRDSLSNREEIVRRGIRDPLPKKQRADVEMTVEDRMSLPSMSGLCPELLEVFSSSMSLEPPAPLLVSPVRSSSSAAAAAASPASSSSSRLENEVSYARSPKAEAEAAARGEDSVGASLYGNDDLPPMDDSSLMEPTPVLDMVQEVIPRTPQKQQSPLRDSGVVSSGAMRLEQVHRPAYGGDNAFVDECYGYLGPRASRQG